MRFLRKYTYLAFFIILLLMNCYLLWLNVKLKVEYNETKKVYYAELENIERQNRLEKIRIKNKELLNKKLNLVAIWGENGCGACKDKMAKEFPYYKKEFGTKFQFVYIGNRAIGPKVFGVYSYLTKLVKSENDLFYSPIRILQPLILLSNNSGDVLLSHEMSPGDTSEFNRFNRSAIRILKLSQ